MTQFQRHDLYPSYPLLARDFETGLGALSSAFDDEDLIPILDREDDSDLSRPDSSSRCSSLSIPSPEWICPLKDSLPSCNHILGSISVAYQLPRAPPPTPLITSPNVLPRCRGELHLEVPPLALSSSLAELGVCAAMGNPVFIRRPSWDFNVEENLNYKVEQMSAKSIPEPWEPLCAFCDMPGPHATFDDQKPAAAVQKEVPVEEHKTLALESQLYQFPPLATYGHSCCAPSTPPPSICSEGSLDDDQEEITWHSFLRQPYSLVEIDYQLQLLSIQQQANAESEPEPQLDLELAETDREQLKDKLRLGNKPLSSVERAGGTLKRRISRAIKRSLSR